MELVPWEPFLSEEEQQVPSLEPKRWAAASGKYPLALPALTVDAEEATVQVIVSAVLVGGITALAAPNSTGLSQMTSPRAGAG